MLRLLAETPPDAGEEPMSAPPPFDENTKLDFSRFHPLDHSLLGCWRRNAYQPIYGKTWYHLKTAWTYKWSSELRAATLCRAGYRHSYASGWARPWPDGEWVATPERCIWCGKDKEP